MSEFKEIEVLESIYEIAFSKEEDRSINVFLCGLNPDEGESLRSEIYKKIKNNPRINTVFPEWLFSNLLRSSEHNLLDLEKDLAESVDIIVMPLEGIGTIAELGSFSSFEGLARKILVINKEKYKRKRSFINQGPIKIIRSYNKRNIYYYNEDNIDEMTDSVRKRIVYFRKDYHPPKLDNFFNISRFLLYIIAIFQPIEKEYLQKLLLEMNPNIPEYYLDPCIEILFDKQYLELIQIEDNEKYILSHFGNHYVNESLLYKLHIIKTFTKLRTKVLYNQCRAKKKFNLEVEKAKILVAR